MIGRKIHRRVFVSCSHAKACNVTRLLTFCSKTVPVERATQLWRLMRKTTSCKQSKAGNSNTSGTGPVRVSAQGLVSILQYTFTTNILLSQLTAPGSPRMVPSVYVKERSPSLPPSPQPRSSPAM